MRRLDISNGEKKCTECGCSKTLDNFYEVTSREGRTPYFSMCKVCVSELAKLRKIRLRVKYNKRCVNCGVLINKDSTLCRNCYPKSNLAKQALQKAKAIRNKNKKTNY